MGSIEKNQYICKIYQLISKKEEMNRLKAVLAEQRRTGKWLAETLGRDQSTVSRWCSNKSQPPMDTMHKIANLLDIDVKELIISTK